MYISEPCRDPWKIHRFRFEVGKNLQEWEGEGDKEGKGEKTGVRKLKVKKGRKKKGEKENYGDRENRTIIARIDLEPFAQEPNALPVAYCDSPASL